jgi:hypothetical protein
MPMPDLIHPHDDARGDVHPLPVSRRKFLTRSAAAVAGGVLFSCTGGKVIPHVTDDPTPAIDTATPIKRVIYVMLENRSFNNVFGAFPGVEGTSTGVSYGQEMPLTPCPDWLPGDNILSADVVTADGKFVYTLNSVAGSVGIFAVQKDGTLLNVGFAGGVSPLSGFNGIAAF